MRLLIRQRRWPDRTLVRPVVRLAGLPTKVLVSLQFPRTADLAERLVRGEQWLAAEGGALADALHDVIGTLAGDPAKPGLVGLRRALYKGRPPKPPEWCPQVEALLPEPVAGRVRRWLARRAQWHRRRAALDPLLVAEHADRVEALRTVAADPLFRRALWHGSRTLSDELDRWLDHPHQTPRRPVQLRLAKYLSRASAKSSVFSSFAVTGFGRWVGGAPQPDGPPLRPVSDQDLRTVTACDDLLRERVVSALAEQPGLWRVLAVRVNPSRTTGPDGADHWFLGPPLDEPVRVLKPHPMIERCIEQAAVNEVTGTWTTMASLTDRLQAATGLDQSRVRDYLRRLAGAGLLEVGPPPDAQPAISLAGLVRWAAAGDDPALVAALRRLEEALRDTERQPDLTSHRISHRAVQAAAQELAGRLGFPAGQPQPANDALVAAGPLADCALPRWRAALADLSALRGWLALFDQALPLRRALRHWWDGRHPDHATVPLLVLYQQFREAATTLDTLFTAPTSPDDLIRSPVPGLPEVGKLRSAALAELPTTSEIDEQVRIPVADLRRVAAAWPAWVRPIDEMTCYLQHDGGQAILNRLDTGYGTVSHRTGHLLRHAGADPGVRVREPDRVVLAELSGLHGTALNAREPRLPYEIGYPFAASARPAAQRISLADLLVTRAPDGDLRLHSARLGTEVQPVYNGALMLTQLPPLARLLIAGFGRPAPPYTVPMPHLGPLTGPTRRPRVGFGSVVVRRARWAFPAALVPARTAGETDAGYLLRLTSWRLAHKLPERCFVRALPRGDQTLPPRVDGVRVRAYGTQRKPLYLDFTSWFLVLAFENVLRTPREFVVFEEALPDPTATSRVSELLVEVAGEPQDDLR